MHNTVIALNVTELFIIFSFVNFISTKKGERTERERQAERLIDG